jgi:uncharacterized protein (DUF58 family)
MLDEAAQDRLGGLMLTAQRLVDGLYAGEHPTPRHGPGVEFHDYRPYAAGDDPAAIDWRVFGRTERYYLRRHEHHGELPTVLVLDRSASMDWPTGEHGASHKLTHARQLAAALALLADRQSDPVGLGVWDGAQLAEWAEPARGAQHVHHLGQLLEQAQPAAGEPASAEAARRDSGPATLGEALHAVAGRLTRRSLVVVISDWLDPPAATLAAVARLAGAGHEVLALQVLSPAELAIERLGAGPTELIDPETADRRDLDPRRAAAAYRAALDEHLATLRQGLATAHGDYALLASDTPATENLRQVLITRAGRG